MSSGKSLRARAPASSTASVRNVMVANWGGNTAPERRLRSALHKSGLRFFIDYRPVPEIRCTADVVFPKAKVCVFVDGCFWHGCRLHFKSPKSNTGWWREKIQGNRDRDRKQSQLLKSHGWTVVRVWEHAVFNGSLERLVRKIKNTVSARGCCSASSVHEFGSS